MKILAALALLLITASASAVSTAPAPTLDATDWLCMRRCTAQGYQWQYCQRVCGY